MRSRREQVYVWTLRELNSLGITLDGRTLTKQALNDCEYYLDPTVEELVSLFAGLVALGVNFVAENAEAARQFSEHPLFSKIGTLGVKA